MKTYPFNKSVNVGRLSTELLAAAVPLVTVRVFNAASGEVVTEDAAVDATVQAVVAAHDATPTEGELLDALALPGRVQAALVLRASSLFAGLSAARRNRVMAIIDTYAQNVIDRLS